MSKTYSMTELKQTVLSVMKQRVESYTQELVALRKKELESGLRKAELNDLCLLCASPYEGCQCLSKSDVAKCGDSLPVKPSTAKMAKADVPMAPAPTKEGGAPHSRSVGGSPKIGLSKSSPIFAKPKAKSAQGLHKSEDLGACLFCAKAEHAGKCSS